MLRNSFITKYSYAVSSIRVLGSGSSSSTPTIRCLKNIETGPCPRCKDAIENPLTSKNKRGNPSIVLSVVADCESNNNNDASFSILVDMGKTFRDSLLRIGPKILTDPKQFPPVKAIMLSHFHADAMNSLDDVREFSVEPVPCFCDHVTANHVKRRDPHLIRLPSRSGQDAGEAEGKSTEKQKQRRYVGALDVKPFELFARPNNNDTTSGEGEKAVLENDSSADTKTKVLKNVDVLGLPVDFCALYHGMDCTSLGFVFKTKNNKKVAYFSDIGRLCPVLDREVVEASKNCDLLFLDCIGSNNKFVAGAHFILEETVAATKLIQPKSLKCVGMGHTDDHDELNAKLKEMLKGEVCENDCECAFDGMLLEF